MSAVTVHVHSCVDVAVPHQSRSSQTRILGGRTKPRPPSCRRISHTKSPSSPLSRAF